MGYLARKGKRKKGRHFQSNQKQRERTGRLCTESTSKLACTDHAARSIRGNKTGEVMEGEESQVVFEFDVVMNVKPFKNFE